ncbi:MAG: fructose-specific PTS transporter subunit EIIC [Elusimicrobiota bacterium]|nr:fructose-specific PTS transporter subunit EIIC [Elusimicrobiota bacterium]
MSYKIVGATGCPTGIAHTYMAKEALERAAKKAGVTIKLEAHGQAGVENALTPQEIQEADIVIIAADKDVNGDRFAGKKALVVPVGKALRNPDELIANALSGKGVSIYKGKVQKPSASSSSPLEQGDDISSSSNESVGRQIYKHLMNGVSHMIPFVVGGGVLIAISFLFGIYSADPSSDQYNSFAAMIKNIGGAAMGLMVPVLSAFIAQSIAKRPGLVVGFVTGMIALNGGTGFLGAIVSGFMSGYLILFLDRLLKDLPETLRGVKLIFLFPVLGVFIGGSIMVFLSDPMNGVNEWMMKFLSGFQESNPLILGIIVGCMAAFDMGGPVNKAAYVTGTVLLAQGNYFFMAGVSAACIAPPLTTAFAVIVFKKYFDMSEYNAGLVNIILGATHITEGAIPFAAKDPLRILPTFMFGSSIAAVLSYALQIQVPAPHGGFLVLPAIAAVSHRGWFDALLWVIVILIGSVIAGTILGLIQKRRYLRDKGIA